MLSLLEWVYGRNDNKCSITEQTAEFDFEFESFYRIIYDTDNIHGNTNLGMTTETSCTCLCRHLIFCKAQNTSAAPVNMYRDGNTGSIVTQINH